MFVDIGQLDTLIGASSSRRKQYETLINSLKTVIESEQMALAEEIPELKHLSKKAAIKAAMKIGARQHRIEELRTRVYTLSCLKDEDLESARSMIALQQSYIEEAEKQAKKEKAKAKVKEPTFAQTLLNMKPMKSFKG